MRKNKISLTYSPSDLIRFMESPFAVWMERLRFPNLGGPKPVSCTLVRAGTVIAS